MGGVSPAKAGSTHLGLPVFKNVAEVITLRLIFVENPLNNIKCGLQLVKTRAC